MANPEHVEIVKRGTTAIAEWRKKHSKETLDLSGAIFRPSIRGVSTLAGTGYRVPLIGGVDLSGTDLSGANFHGAKLAIANFSKTNLVGADLVGASLDHANLSGADLSEAKLNSAVLSSTNCEGAAFVCADLYGAILKEAKLVGANLSGADLRRANICGSELTQANFEKVRCSDTLFVDVNLSNTIGLDTVEHSGPSSVGIDTLYKSQFKIPEIFLRGCGVPDGLIEQLPSLIGKLEAIQFYSCFISYSHKDEEFCERLYSRMRDEHLRVWYAPEDMKSGEKIHEQIDQAIRVHDKLLVVLSETSMSSEWVATEIRKARKREVREGKRVLFPIRLCSFDELRDWECFDADTGKDMAVEIREYFIPDFSNWKEHDAFEKGFARLLEDLKAAGS